MEVQISTANLEICSNFNHTEKAWHFASILLILGRPASPVELAGRCTLFRASPEFVEFLSAIPNSPICLTANHFVVLSLSAISAFGEFVANSMPKVEFRVIGGERMLRSGEDLLRKYVRKRKKVGNEMVPIAKRRAVLRCVEENERNIASINGGQRISSDNFKGVELQTDPGMFEYTQFGKFENATNLLDVGDVVVIPTTMNSSIKLLECPIEVDEDQEGENKPNKCIVNDIGECVAAEIHQELCYANRKCLDLPDLNHPLLESLAGISAMLEDSQDETNLVIKLDNGGPFCPILDKHEKNLSVESTAVKYTAKDLTLNEGHETKVENLTEQPLINIGGPLDSVDSILVNSWGEIFSSLTKLPQTNKENPIGGTHDLKRELKNIKSTSQPLVSADPQCSAQLARTKSSALKNAPQAELPPKQESLSKLIQHNKLDVIDKERRDKKHRIAIAMMDKPKRVAKKSPSIQERCDNGNENSKDQQKPKFPVFESYTVEEEEGSGGYGTVYRARRKTDGLTFAVKCPHPNAQSHHVKNELKMLEKFGGKSFVIRYEGSLKNEGSDCFILEHVEHDRPEVLKREIDVSQLQWYGYCMFKALFSLHKKGVFHRDIKPGNFLFSRKTHKGFLIDFNLAKDMHQNHVNLEKSKPSNVTAAQHISAGNSKSTSPNKQKKHLGAPDSKTLKKKPVDKLRAYEDFTRCNSLTSQGADGSGITSTKTISADRLREPLPCKGRKALINLAQEAMQSPNHGATKPPASNRKRVSASPGITDRKLMYPTPTPLHSCGMAISGAGSLKNRGEAKMNKDGPCVGTKGFRAPEVLLRSLHQGPKIDVWSAGVTLLYLISGRLPFNGDPEQNLKEIVKLKGNEELWELAKLHNRESSFPVELLDIRYLPSMTIRDWYLAHTKRPNLYEAIPSSLFDLLEKCLTVNPRLRITAEEALNHEFFAPCHEAFRKHRSSNSRHDQNQDAKCNSLPLLYEPVRPPKEVPL